MAFDLTAFRVGQLSLAAFGVGDFYRLPVFVVLVFRFIAQGIGFRAEIALAVVFPPPDASFRVLDARQIALVVVFKVSCPSVRAGV